ncbi:trypco2 family protein [Arenicella xantha]|uniref:Trypsin-co-occurring domain-containing protein n=1 Tax=Arenicella xantha TaxID=644221 RepID=A0A395JIA2_9GAMM|nr:trypco2 family protein [Arenicella xantha]RBP48667.1 hypothetical protein DFR28_1055 [Arenicella xantha]
MNLIKLSTLVFAIMLSASTKASDAQESEIEIASVVEQIQNGIDIAKKGLAADSLPNLQSVTLNLNTAVKRDGGPKFKFLIFSFGKKWTSEASQTTTITLVPKVPRVTPTSAEEISDSIAKMIIAAADGVSKASAHASVPLELGSLSIQQKFIVKNETSGGFSIELLSIEASGSYSEANVQTMTITFK